MSKGKVIFSKGETFCLSFQQVALQLKIFCNGFVLDENKFTNFPLVILLWKLNSKSFPILERSYVRVAPMPLLVDVIRLAFSHFERFF